MAVLDIQTEGAGVGNIRFRAGNYVEITFDFKKKEGEVLTPYPFAGTPKIILHEKAKSARTLSAGSGVTVTGSVVSWKFSYGMEKTGSTYEIVDEVDTLKRDTVFKGQLLPQFDLLEYSVTQDISPVIEKKAITMQVNITKGGGGTTGGNGEADHTHANKTTLDQITVAYTTAKDTELAANTTARHTHANKTLLDNTTGTFTTARETKLDALPTSTDLTTALAGKQPTVSLTTTGTSGAATFNATTGALNIPNYTTSGTGVTDGDKGDVVVSNSGATWTVEKVYTKSDVGLSNVDNTSDAAKPISTATQAALNNKAPLVNGLVPEENLPDVVYDPDLFEGKVIAVPTTGQDPVGSAANPLTLKTIPVDLLPGVDFPVYVDNTANPFVISDVVVDGKAVKRITLSATWLSAQIDARLQSYSGWVNNNTVSLRGNLTYEAAGASLMQLSTPTISATVISDTQINLSWSDVANESSYKLEWSANGTSGWTQIGGTIATGTTSYSHTGLTASTQYFYRVSAIGDGVTYSTSGFGTANGTTQATPVVNTPPSTANLVAWYDPSDSANYTVATGYSQVVDKSVSSHTVDQATGANQPTVTTINGLNAMLFNGTSQYLSNTSPFMWAAGAITVLAVVKGAAQSDKRLIAEGSSTDTDPIYSGLATGATGAGAGADSHAGFAIRTNDGVHLSAGGVSQPLGETGFNNTTQILTITDSGSVYSSYRNTTAGATPQTYSRSGAVLTLDRFAIGALLRSTPGSYYTGVIGEIRIFSRVLNSTELAAERTYLATKWGVTL